MLQTFNEFFIRELKPGARPIVSPECDDVAVCAADSRLMAFKTVEDSMRFWIKVHISSTEYSHTICKPIVVAIRCFLHSWKSLIATQNRNWLG